MLTFDEFLAATDKLLYTYYNSITREQSIEEIFHQHLLDAYNHYLIVGGMPECVVSWVKYKDSSRISQIHKELIEVYENDFSKHNGNVNSGRILMVFRSIEHSLQNPIRNSCMKLDYFKLFIFGTGLLKTMAGIDNKI